MEIRNEVFRMTGGEVLDKLKRRPLETLGLGLSLIILLTSVLLSISVKTDKTTQSPILIQKKQTSDTSMYADIGGAVRNPGVYPIVTGQRIYELIEKSGGLTASADLSYIDQNINRAQKLNDQAKIFIPYIVSNAVSPIPKVETSSLISINNDSQKNLEGLPGVGPVTAQAIITNRPYTNLDELLSKKVLSSSLYEKIKSLITL